MLNSEKLMEFLSDAMGFNFKKQLDIMQDKIDLARIGLLDQKFADAANEEPGFGNALEKTAEILGDFNDNEKAMYILMLRMCLVSPVGRLLLQVVRSFASGNLFITKCEDCSECPMRDSCPDKKEDGLDI